DCLKFFGVEETEIIKVTNLDYNLTLLQEKIKKDPESYRQEFSEQFEHFKQNMKLLNIQPTQHRMNLQPILELVVFLSKTAIYYKNDAEEFARLLVNILTDQGPALHHHIRESFCESLLSLRNRKHLDTIQLLQLFFELCKIEDKNLRKFISTAIVSIIKKLSKSNDDLKLKTKMQVFLFAKLKDSRAVVARLAQMVLINVFRRGFWKDNKTANAIGECVFHRIPKIQVSAMKFFLGTIKDEEGVAEDTDSEDEQAQNTKTLKEVMCAFRAAKKTRKKEKMFEKAKKTISKDKKEKKEGKSKFCNLYAIQSLYDPQQFVDRLFKMLESGKNEKFEVRVIRMALCARVIGVHKLQTLGFYSFLHRYLNPKQREVTRILLYAAQACHDLVPPDLVENLVKVIANNFVTDKASTEAIVVGLNTIREIYSNCPHAADPDLVQDLVQYRSYKNKNVAMASKGIVTLFREINPSILHRKDRGRPTEKSADIDENEIKFGSLKAKTFIPGAEILYGVEEGMEMEDIDSDASEDWVDLDVNDKDDSIKNEKNEKVDDEEDEVSGEEDEISGEEDEISGEEDEISGEEDIEDEEVEVDDEEYLSDSHDVEKNTQTEEKKVKIDELNPDERIAKAQEISENRIFTDSDFKRIRIHQLQRAIMNKRGTKRKQTNADVQIEEEFEEKKIRKEEGDGLPRLNDIEHFHKKIKKQSKEERLAQVKEGREGRESYAKKTKTGDHVGRTNRELAKKKNFSMIKQKARNSEKAQTTLARWLKFKELEERGPISKRPANVKDCTNVQDAERFLGEVSREITKNVTLIQNPGLGEGRIRDLNDEINKLIKIKEAWEKRIRDLGGPDHRRLRGNIESSGAGLASNRGYKYFGAAKDLPGVRELFAKEADNKHEKDLKKDSYIKNPGAVYFGLLDDDNEKLVELEKIEEEIAKQKIEEEWKIRNSVMNKSHEFFKNAFYINDDYNSVIEEMETEDFVDDFTNNTKIKRFVVPNQEEMTSLLVEAKRKQLFEKLFGV
uniref:Protein SDA1 homolog n=1 Tax=Strongyloides stercoralis TaxID=6248 RepID=A0AAF5D067_STRER